MKILLIDNAALVLFKNSLLCEKKTGDFAKELLDLGNKVTMYGQVVESNNTIHSYNPKNNHIKVVGIIRRKNKIVNYIILYCFVIYEILRSDFVYIFYPSAFKYVSFFCWVLGTPYGLYIRGEQGIESKLSKLIYSKAKVVFTVQKYFTNIVNSLTKRKVAYSIRPMIPLTENDIVSNRFYVNKSDYKVLFLARVEKDKGIIELLQAMSELKKRNYSLTLDLVGDGAYLPEVIKLIKDLNIEDIVYVKGTVLEADKVKQFYLDADLYVLPTYHEGFPRTIYEAMIFGVPVITTFVGGISSVMTDEFNCLKIDVQSVESIVDKIEFSIQNYHRLSSIVNNAINTVTPIISSSKLSHARDLHNIINLK